MSYLGVEPGSRSVRTSTVHTASAGQNTFNVTGGYMKGFVDVFVNGTKTLNFTATDSQSIVLSSNASLNDKVEIIAYAPLAIYSMVNKSGDSMGGDLTLPNLIATANVGGANGYFNNLRVNQNTYINNSLTVIGNTNQTGSLNLTGNLNLSGSLIITGEATSVTTSSLAVEDSIITMAANNTAADTLDIGFAGKYNNGSANVWTGLIRNATDKEYYFFHEYDTTPGNDVDTTDLSFQIANVHANFSGNVQSNNITVVQLNATNLNMTSSITLTGDASGYKQNSTTVYGGDAGAGFGRIEYYANKWVFNAGSDSANIAFFQRGNLVKSLIDNDGNFSATANNANNLGGVAAASYLQTSGSYTISGTRTHTANLEVRSTNLIINSSASIIANGTIGTAGQVLTSNGSTIYWSFSGVNTAAQYTWTNTHTFQNTVTFGNSTVNSTVNSTILVVPSITGNLTGNVTATTISGNLTGNVAATTITGNLTGNVIATTISGNLTGNVVATTLSGNLTGNVAATTITGNLTGNVAATTITGNLTGNVIATTLSGNLAGNVVATTVNTTTMNVSSNLVVGSNVSLNTSILAIGNSTANVYVNSTSFVGNVVATSISGNLTGNVSATTLTGNLTGNVSATTLSGNLTAITANVTNKLQIGTPGSFDFGSNAVIEIDANGNTYVQVVVQNANTGNNASADLVVTHDQGNDSVGYVDLGINGSQYNQASFSITGANDAYLYASDGHLAIGTASAKEVIFHTGGTTSSDRKMTINTSVVSIGNSTLNVYVNSTSFVGNVSATTLSGNLTGNVAAVTITGNLTGNVTATTITGNLTGNVVATNINAATIQVNTSLTFDNDKNLQWKAKNTSTTVGMRQQSDDNFVFYTTDATYAARPVFSIYANSSTSNLQMLVALNLTTSVGANGSFGTSGQVLTTNGSGVYWSTVSGGGSVNVAAQYAWTNTQSFAANISVTANALGLASNSSAIYFNGTADANWKIGRNTGATPKWFYSNNTLDIIAANSNLEGIVFGWTGNSYLETGYNGTYVKDRLYVGNSTVNVTVNATAFVGNLVGNVSATTITGNLTGNVVAGTVNATTINATSNVVVGANVTIDTAKASFGTISTTNAPQVIVANTSGTTTINANFISTTSITGNLTGNVTATTISGNLTGNVAATTITGNLTGNVAATTITGNLTGNVIATTVSGNLTGNVVATTISGNLTGNVSATTVAASANVTVGANVLINTSAIVVSNSTAVAVHNAGTILVGNSTITTNPQVIVQNTSGALTVNTKIISTTGDELVLTQTGDAFGTTTLRLRNRNNFNGAVFEQGNTSIPLVDFIFSANPTTSRNIRFEARGGQTYLETPEFQIGTAANPAVTIGDSGVLFRNGNANFGSTNVTMNGAALVFTGNNTTLPTVTIANTGVFTVGNTSITGAPRLVLANTSGTTTINTNFISTTSISGNLTGNVAATTITGNLTGNVAATVITGNLTGNVSATTITGNLTGNVVATTVNATANITVGANALINTSALLLSNSTARVLIDTGDVFVGNTSITSTPQILVQNTAGTTTINSNFISTTSLSGNLTGNVVATTITGNLTGNVAASVVSSGNLSITGMATFSNNTSQSNTAAAAWFSGSGGAIAFDTNMVKRISWNDGAGNFQMRAGSYHNGTAIVYNNDGTSGGAAAIVLNNDGVDGAITMSVNPIGTAGATLTAGPSVALNTTTFVITSANLSVASGTTTLNGNLTIAATAALIANGVTGTAGQVLTATASGNVYWAPAAAGDITAVNAGTGLTGGGTTGEVTISMPSTGPGAGSYSGGISAITIDAQGRITSITGSAGYTTTTGDITGITTNSGSGLTGGVTSGTATLAVNGAEVLFLNDPGPLTAGLRINGTTVAAGLGVSVAVPTTGYISASGDITAFASDERFKEDVEPISDALEKVKKIRGVTYRHNALGESLGLEARERMAGVIAQEVEAVLPEVVTLAPLDTEYDEERNKYSISGENYKTVKYDKMIPLLIEAIKELSNQVEELKKRLGE